MPSPIHHASPDAASAAARVAHFSRGLSVAIAVPITLTSPTSTRARCQQSNDAKMTRAREAKSQFPRVALVAGNASQSLGPRCGEKVLVIAGSDRRQIFDRVEAKASTIQETWPGVAIL